MGLVVEASCGGLTDASGWAIPPLARIGLAASRSGVRVAARTRDMGPRELGLSGPFHVGFFRSGCEWGMGTVAWRSDFGQRLHVKPVSRIWDQHMGTIPEPFQFELK